MVFRVSDGRGGFKDYKSKAHFQKELKQSRANEAERIANYQKMFGTYGEKVDKRTKAGKATMAARQKAINEQIAKNAAKESSGLGSSDIAAAKASERSGRVGDQPRDWHGRWTRG